MSRPPKKIDWKRVDELLIAGCLGTEIASHFDMHHDTFYRRVEEKYKISFTAYSQEKKAKGESLIREVQFNRAIGKTKKGDNTMLIWLGKQRLDQRETHEVSIQPETMTQFKSLMDQISKNQEEQNNDS